MPVPYPILLAALPRALVPILASAGPPEKFCGIVWMKSASVARPLRSSVSRSIVATGDPTGPVPRMRVPVTTIASADEGSFDAFGDQPGVRKKAIERGVGREATAYRGAASAGKQARRRDHIASRNP